MFQAEYLYPAVGALSTASRGYSGNAADALIREDQKKVYNGCGVVYAWPASLIIKVDN